jgi:hypothetical protein
MTKKSPIIKQGKVTELMSKLASLPEREKDPDEPVSLSEIFRTKEYAAEVKAALKKGYTFKNLAEIFTERCGIAVSARQIKYHFTRGKNQGVKSKSGKKAGDTGTSEDRISSAGPPGKRAVESTKENVVTSDSEAKHSPKESGAVFENGIATRAEGNPKPGAFSINAKPAES